jgi:hypothetical protein
LAEVKFTGIPRHINAGHERIARQVGDLRVIAALRRPKWEGGIKERWLSTSAVYL